MKQTAVEWLDSELWSLRLKLRGGEITIGQYNEQQITLITKALQMEREQIEQAERSYSEEEVYNLLLKYQNECSYVNNGNGLKHWFNQFKKKP